MARFRIKIDRGRRNPVVLKDYSAPAYLRTFRTLRAAMLHVDNRVRAERGMPPRLDLTRDEIRAAMTRPDVAPKPIAGSAEIIERRHVNAPCFVDPIMEPSE